MTTLSEIHAQYEITMNAEMTAEERDKALARLMTRMEDELGVPTMHNAEWEQENKPVIALYRIISESRSTL